MRVNKAGKGKHTHTHTKKRMMGSEAHLMSIFKLKVKEENARETKELSDKEKNTKSDNTTKSKEKRISRISVSIPAETGLRLVSYY